MHHLRKYILDRLRFEQPLGYSQMLPKDVESSLFQYHLKMLVQEGLVRKADRGVYELTNQGHVALEYMSVGRSDMVRMPKVITFTLLTSEGEYLLYKKPKEPYRNLLELVGGKIHFGEEADIAAQRDVLEKTNLSIMPPAFCGIANVMVKNKEEILTHMTVYIFTAEVDSLVDLRQDRIVAVSSDAVAARDDLAPTTLPRITAINSGNRPFVITLNLEHAW